MKTIIIKKKDYNQTTWFITKTLRGAPEYLKELNLRPVFAPRQDGYREHYAFLDKDNCEVFSCSNLEGLVEYAREKKKELRLKEK